jgi:hypothetical protein
VRRPCSDPRLPSFVDFREIASDVLSALDGLLITSRVSVHPHDTGHKRQQLHRLVKEILDI